MSVVAVLHSEWIKTRSVRASHWALLGVFAVMPAVTLLVFATVGTAEAANGGDRVFEAFYAINFAQIAAVTFGATAVSSEYTEGALRISLSAVPRRELFYTAKTAVVGIAALGLTFLLRSAVAVLGLLIPFLLIVSFVVADIAGGAASWLPDRAGAQVLHQDTTGDLGPWTGLAVTGLWAAAALLAGRHAVRRRDA